MSRIDEALRRARQHASGALQEPDAARPEAPQATVPQEDIFSAPWQFEHAREEDEAIAPAFAEAAQPARAEAEPERPAGARAEPERPAGAEVPRQPAAESEAAGALVAPRQAAGAETGAGSEAATPSLSFDGTPGPMAVFKGFDPAVEEKLVASSRAKAASVEQYRRLASTLHHAQLEKGIRVVMVSSALAGEGKTLTSTNLALTLSESYHRSVLLIDADLRRPTLHEIFQVPNLSGLGDGLRAETEQRLSIVQVSSHLSLLTAGRPDPDPMSGLSSTRMREILDQAAARFDWVIVDTPPVGLLPDAHLLAAMVDASLLVIEAGGTPHALVQKSIDVIGRDRVLGIVLNRAEEGVRFGKYHKYYRYYDGAVPRPKK